MKLWISEFLSEPACHILTFTLFIRIFQLTHSNFLVSLLIALMSIPPVLFSSLAGVLADKINRKHVLLISNASRALVVVGFIFFHTNPGVLIGLAFVVSIISQFFGPAASASIPTLVSREQILKANSIFLFTIYTAFLIGYSLAGPMLFYLKDQIIFIILITMYSAATVVNSLLPSLHSHLAETIQQEIVADVSRLKKICRELIHGLKIIQHNKVVLYSVLQMVFVFSMERSIISLAPEFAETFLKYNISEISYFLVAPLGLGAFFGAMLINKLKKYFDKRKIIIWNVILEGLVLILVPLAHNVQWLHGSQIGIRAYTFSLCLLAGLADVCIVVCVQTFIHETSQARDMGRIFGHMIAFMNLVGIPIILLVGYISRYYPVPSVIFIIGWITVIVGFSTRSLYKRSLRTATT